MSFEPILTAVDEVLGEHHFKEFTSKFKPQNIHKVNYRFITNKDGKYAWRPFELIHPAIYVSLVNLICESKNWECLKKRISDFNGNRTVESYSLPVVADDGQKDVAAQIKNWWVNIEQRSLINSLEFSHLLQTDVVNCYGSFYTHSIPWSIHGKKSIRKSKNIYN